MPEPIEPDATLGEQIDETPEPVEPVEGENELGDAGKKALDAMKAKWKAADALAKAANAKIATIEAAAALKDKPAEEQALEAARAEARAEATTAANARIIKSELRLAAKGVLADPADALAFIDLSDFTVSEDGDVDSDALNEAIAELIANKPHLAAGKPNRFDGGADQGAKGRDAKPSQLSEADLQNMSPAEVNQARKDGRLSKLLGTST